MKTIWIFIFAFLISNNIYAGYFSENKAVNSICDDKDCLNYLEEYQIKNVALGVSRKNDILIISTKNKIVTFKDIKPTNSSDTSGVKYNLIEYVKDIQQYVVVGRYYEWTEFTLISNEDGSQVKMPSTPVFSPNKKYVVSYYNGEGTPGIEIWWIDNATLKKMYESSNSNGFGDGKFKGWVTPDSFLIEKLFDPKKEDKCDQYQSSHVTVKFILSDYEWKEVPSDIKPFCGEF